MPVTVESLQSGSLLLEVWAGRVDSSELLQCPDVGHAPRVLIDAVHASFPDTVPEPVRLGERGADARVALVAPAHDERGVGFYERLCVRYGANVIVFNSIVTACAWLDADLADLEERITRIRDSLLSR